MLRPCQDHSAPVRLVPGIRKNRDIVFVERFDPGTGFRSFGAGRTFPLTLGGRPQLSLAAVGDLTALDPTLRKDFRAMVELGLLEELEDADMFNWFRLDGDFNAHAEYGYLANGKTARMVGNWWRRQRQPR